jgi:hypothetical protein
MDHRLREIERTYSQDPSPKTLQRYNSARERVGLKPFLPVEHLQNLFDDIRVLLGNPEVSDLRGPLEAGRLEFYGNYKGVWYYVQWYSTFGIDSYLEIAKSDIYGDSDDRCIHELTLPANPASNDIILNSDCREAGLSSDFYATLSINQPWVYSAEKLLEFAAVHWADYFDEDNDHLILKERRNRRRNSHSYRRNADEHIRNLERAAAGGDIDAQYRLTRHRIRAGDISNIELATLATAGDLVAKQYLMQRLSDDPDILKFIVGRIYRGEIPADTLDGIHELQKSAILIDDWSDSDYGFLVYWHPGGRNYGPRFMMERWDDPYYPDGEDIPTDAVWTIYQIDIPVDVFAEHTWAEPEQVASSVDESAEELVEQGRDPDVRARIRVLWSMTGYWGLHEFDHYPLELDRAGMLDRYADHVGWAKDHFEEPEPEEPEESFRRNPWSPSDVSRHNKRCGSRPACRRKWPRIANAVLKKSGDEGKAIRIANWQTKRMGLRRNPDDALRQAERAALNDFDSFLRYRAMLARVGRFDDLQLKKGMFAIGFHGGLDFVKSSGQRSTVTVGCYCKWEEDRWTAHLEGRSKQKGTRGATNTFLDYNVLVPPELAGYMEQIRAEHYLRWATDPGDERPGRKHWVTSYPAYQEELYLKLVNTLEELGYRQPHRLPEIECSKGCGRNMGISTPARRRESMCFYCWEKAHKLGDEWLQMQLEDNEGYRKQT